MGLWMGGSILSFVHLFVFIVLILCADDKLWCQRDGSNSGRNRRDSSPDRNRSPDGVLDTDCDDSDPIGDRLTIAQSHSRSATEVPQTTTTYYDWSAKNLNGGGAVFSSNTDNLNNGSIYTSFRV